MSDNTGYIALYRKIRENTLWAESRTFSKAEAWLDILMEVRWKEDPSTVVMGMRTIQCNYGESLRSIDQWASRWGWGIGKTYRFLKLLEKEQMIVVKSETITTRLTVCNYELYDIKRNANGTEAERERNASGDIRRRERRNKKENNNPPAIPKPLDTPEFRTAWAEWAEHRRQMKKPLSSLAEKKQLNSLAKLSAASAIACIEKSISNGWQGLFPENFEMPTPDLPSVVNPTQEQLDIFFGADE